jgi:hypothetical protein
MIGGIILANDNKKEDLIIEGMDNETVLKLQEEARIKYESHYKPQLEKEQAEQEKQFDKMITTSKLFRKRFDPERYIIKMQYQKDYYEFKVKPIDEQDDLSYMDLEMDIYSILNPKERKVIEKVVKQEKLRPNEEKILEDINKKQNKLASKKLLTMANQLLANHLLMFNEEIEDFELYPIDNWKYVDFVLRIILADEVKTILGIDSNTTMELFRPD